MLTSVNIQHFVLIDHLSLSFDRGLSVFTGETGAGKSILLDALSLLLGNRAETRFIARGSDQAVVSATFSLAKTHPAFKILDEQGLSHEDELVIRRSISRDGKSKCFICDQPVSVGLLKELGETLIEIHGQFATHGLLNPSTHRFTLDNYGGLEKDLHQVHKLWDEWQTSKQAVVDFEAKLSQQKMDEDFMKSSLEELETLHPVAGEEETLVQKRTALMNAEKIIEKIKMACELLGDDEQGILRLLSKTDTQLSFVDQVAQGSVTEQIHTLNEVQDLLNDLSSDLEHKLNDLGDTSELPAIDERLFCLRDLARKHHVEISELPDLQEKLSQDLKLLINGVEELVNLKKQAEKVRLNYLEAARNLSQKRHHCAEQLQKAVMKELPDLKLEKATFAVDVHDLDEVEAQSDGMNQVTFMVATNKGSTLTPIHKCASGGELSRFMLALKVNLADRNRTTLIFDEIDTGISGGTASAVGERLKRLADSHQTLVITHSPQVAGFGKNHYLVQKADTTDATVTSVLKLDHQGRLEEIARLVSGATITDKSRELAQELLKN